MNSKEFHQATILGLIQTTINRTFLDLERRRLFEVTTGEQLINWTELRSLTNEINWLFDREINSHRERISIENLITEIHLRSPSIYIVLVNSNAFDQALSNGIRSYSRHIKRNNITVAPGVRGVFEQTLNEQINYGIQYEDSLTNFFKVKELTTLIIVSLSLHNKILAGVYLITKTYPFIEQFLGIILKLFTRRLVENYNANNLR